MTRDTPDQAETQQRRRVIFDTPPGSMIPMGWDSWMETLDASEWTAPDDHLDS